MALGTKKISEMPFVKFKTYTVSEANSYGADTAGAGAIIRVSDGNAGEPCLAMSDGVNWKIIATLSGNIDVDDFNTINTLNDYGVNMYQDSGRFGGEAVTSIQVTTFDYPDYLTLYNSSTVESIGKFIHNNNDYGGSAGNLNTYVKDLVDKIRDVSARRYGNEFFVAQVTMGPGTQASTIVSGKTGYMSTYTAQLIRPPKMTFHAYVRAVDDDIILPLDTGQVAYIDGVKKTASSLITVADEWVSVMIHDQTNPRTSYGYLPSAFRISAQSEGDKFLLACPALIGGITRINPDSGVVAAFNSYSSA